ncbi:MAG: ATP-dependent DNA helicase RecG [Patescibacteria group bacterium]
MEPETPLEELFRLSREQKKGLTKLGVHTIRDLLYLFPSRYGDVYAIKYISDVSDRENVTLYGRITNIQTGKTFKRGVPEATAVIEDDTAKAKIRWFHQPYIAKKFSEGSLVKLEGEGKRSKNGSLLFINPEISIVSKIPHGVGNSLFEDASEQFLQPVYPESKGVTSRFIRYKIKELINKEVLDQFADPIPSDVLEKYSLPSLRSSLIFIHNPKSQDDSLVARKRFAFQEVFFIQLKKQLERKRREKHPSFSIAPPEGEVTSFIKRFPFSPTEAQERAMKEILADMSNETPMSRLLEGDVGSGKTAVASVASFATVMTRPPKEEDQKNRKVERESFGNLQVAYMVPTEILAQQQFEGFIKYFSHLNIKVGLITSSGCRKFPSKVDPKDSTNISRRQLLEWVDNGEIPILIGTHSLIQKSVKFKNLALVIIDEQHRFGMIQRQDLLRKDKITPHLLSMTATPIPRTLALTVYGDLDLTLIDEMPAGRKQVRTKIASPAQREEMFKEIKEELKKGRQAYVICPRINAPDPDQENALNVASVEEEVEYLKENALPDFSIEALHGKMSSKEKEEVMKRFTGGEIDVLVSTSVIEVGVNVENATVIAIESAERFGLAQLHQLRGRVLRSSHQSYCYVFSDTESDKSIKRLRALKKAKNGFELAEFDLAQRGAGELYGKKQWGVSDMAMEAIKNIKMVEAARKEAQDIIEKDEELKSFPNLKKQIEDKDQFVHFE